MKKIMVTYGKMIIMIMVIFVTPAVMASVITLDPLLYIQWVCHPAYDAVMILISTITTAVAFAEIDM